MLGDYQKYEVTAKFTFEAEVFPEDPDDVFELARLELDSVEAEIFASFPSAQMKELRINPVVPIIGD